MAKEKNWMEAFFDKDLIDDAEEFDAVVADILAVIAKYPMSIAKYEAVMEAVERKVKAVSSVAV